MADETVLDVRDLVTRFYTYDGVVRALEGVSFDIKKGETVGLVGETGCGKSVTALSVLRLIPSPPGRIEAGEILFRMPVDEAVRLRAAEDALWPLLRQVWKTLPVGGNGWTKGFAARLGSDRTNPMPHLSLERAIEVANAVRRASVPRQTKEGKRPALPPELTKVLLEHFKTIYSLRSKYDLLAKDEAYMQAVRGNAISMIFQEPMSALNPVIPVGDQIAENILLHQEKALAKEALTWLDLELRMMGTKPVMPRMNAETAEILCPVCKAPNYGRPSACASCRARFVYPAWGIPESDPEGRHCPFCAAVSEESAAEDCETCHLPFHANGGKPGHLEPGSASLAGLSGNPLRRAKLQFYRSLYVRKALTPAERAAREARAKDTTAKPGTAPAAARPPQRAPAAAPVAPPKVAPTPAAPMKDPLSVRVAARIPVIRRYRRVMYDRAMRHAIKMLHEVRIPDPDKVVDSYPFELSGGMAQRVLIAIALSCNPQLLIADEPTTALDVTIQAQILKLMRELKSDIGSSVLLITHNLGVVAETCDRVGVMYAGTIVEMASAHTIFKDPLHPYTRGLMESIPSVTVEKDRLAMIHGNVPNLIHPPAGCRFHPRCPLAAQVCQETVPEVRELAPQHFVACHMVGGGAHA